MNGYKSISGYFAIICFSGGMPPRLPKGRSLQTLRAASPNLTSYLQSFAPMSSHVPLSLFAPSKFGLVSIFCVGMYPNNLYQLTDFVLLYLITSYICLINFYGCQNVSQYPYPLSHFFTNLLRMSECVPITFLS